MAKGKGTRDFMSELTTGTASVDNVEYVDSIPGTDNVPNVKATKYTISLPPLLLERLRNAAYWSRLPLAAIIERAVTAELERMESENGKPYEQRPENLRAGRPVR